MSLLEFLLAFFIVGAVTVSLLFCVPGDDVEPYIFKVRLFRMWERSLKNGYLEVGDERLIFYDPHKLKRELVTFDFSFKTFPKVVYVNGFVSGGGTVIGKNWSVTIEPATGRMRIK